MEKNLLTSGIDHLIYKSIDNSININSIETLQVIVSFISKIAFESIENNSISTFEKYVKLIPYIYGLSYEKRRNNNGYIELNKYGTEIASQYLKEIIVYYLPYKVQKCEISSNEKLIIDFYYICYKSFSNLLYYSVRNKDTENFNKIMNEFGQIDNLSIGVISDLKWNVRKLNLNNDDGKHDIEINELNSKLNLYNTIEKYKRHCLLGIKYWSLFLFQREIINNETLTSFLERLEINNEYITILNDLLELLDPKKTKHGYLNWNEWDFMERPKGVIYHPPNINRWLIFGFTIDSIRNNYYLDLSQITETSLNQIEYISSVIAESIEYLDINYKTWSDILKGKDEQIDSKKWNDLLKLFEAKKNQLKDDIIQEIAESKINTEFVENFKKMVYEKWNTYSRIYNIFKDFKSVNESELKSESLLTIGEKLFIERGKSMFISGKHNLNIFGLERYGEEIGKWGDDYFIDKIQKENSKTINAKNIIDSFKKGIKKIRSNGFEPSAIIVSPEIIYRETQLINNPKFSFNNNNNNTINSIIGTYENIPIYSSYSNLLRNKTVVCNIQEAFQLEIESNPNYVEGILNVEISEVTDDIAQKQIQLYPLKWLKASDGSEIIKDKAIQIIKNSILLDIWSKFDYKIKNKNAYCISVINSVENKD